MSIPKHYFISRDDLPEGFALVLVHPGSLYTSGRAQVSDERFEVVTDHLQEALDDCTGLVVIDGMFSDGLPRGPMQQLREKLHLLSREGCISVRAWGDDEGAEAPDWWGHRPATRGVVANGQADAARQIAQELKDHHVICAGAWASRDGSSGCVTAVADALRGAGHPSVRIAEFSLFEEDIDWDEDFHP